MNNQLKLDKLFESVNSTIAGTLDDAYDYRTFFPGWEFDVNINYRSLIKNTFGLADNEVKSFIDRDLQLWIYDLLLSNLASMDNDSTIKLLRYCLSLPMLDYEILIYNGKPTIVSTSNNKFVNSLRGVVFDKIYVKEINYNEVIQCVRDLISNSSIESIQSSLKGFAFREHVLIYRNLSNEAIYKGIFMKNLAEPVCKLLAKTTGYDIKIVEGFNIENYESNADKRYLVWSDLYLVLDYKDHKGPGEVEVMNREVCCTIEVKPFPMIPYVFGPPQVGFEFFSMTRIPSYMKEAILQLVYHWINYGILTDVYTTCCFLIDLDIFEKNQEYFYKSITNHGDRLIPMKYLVLNNLSSLPSIKESLLYHFFKSVSTFLQMDNRKERMRQFRIYLQKSNQELSQHDWEVDSSVNESKFESHPDRSISGGSSSYSGHRVSYYSEPGLETIEEQQEDEFELNADDDIYLQHGVNFNSQIFKIDAKYLKKFLVYELNDEKKLVVKVYDHEISRMRYKSSTNRREAILDSMNGYKMESSILKELHNDEAFNSCYVPHSDGQILIKRDGKEIAGGHFNLLEFIDSIQLPKDLNTYKKAKQQLDIIHKHGIIHGDIKEDNILCSKEKVVYIIDFQYSSRFKHQTISSKLSDIRDLKHVFGLYDDL